jgi:hypothetical protein
MASSGRSWIVALTLASLWSLAVGAEPASAPGADYALMNWNASPEQIAQAQSRFQQYLSHKKNQKIRAKYVAVETLPPGNKLKQAYQQRYTEVELSAAAHGSKPSQQWVSPNQLHCVMIFDAQSKQLASTKCYVVGALPAKGQVARFDTFEAEMAP